MFNNSVYIQFLRKSFNLLDRELKLWSYKVFILTVINSFIEVLGLALIVPVLYLVNDPTPIHQNKIINAVYSGLPFQNEQYFILFLLLLLLVIFILKNAFAIFTVYYQSRFSFDAALKLTERQAKRYLNKDYLDAVGENSNYSLRYISIYPEEFAAYVLMPLIYITNEALVLGLIVAGLAIYNIKIFVLLLVTLLPISALILKATKSKAYRIGELRNEFRPKSFKQIFETIYSYVDIKVFESQNFFIQRIKKAFRKLYDITIKDNLYQILPQRVLESIIILSIVVLYVFIIFFLKSSVNELILILILFATAAYRVMPSFDRILKSLIQMKSHHYVFDELVTPLGKHTQTPLTRIVSFNDQIELRSVSYNYKGKEEKILKETDLILKKGSFVGIVGSSGAGKTTILKILVGLIKPDSGEIFIDGKSVHNSTEQWFKLIAFIDQNPYLLDSSLKENIAFGVPNDKIDGQRLNEVIKQSRLDDFVYSLNEGVDSIIGEFGVKISSGQKQRIAIARALYKQAQILIFDETLNAIDQFTEAQILDNWKSLLEQDVTIILVSHKLESLVFCDHIYELKDGELIMRSLEQ
ncbi:MAG: ABC transporter ATP-binding protein [Chitinophagales bacterium]